VPPVTSPDDPVDCWYLTGATAVGKTGVGLALAAELRAEVISLDSMAIYRGMDIGTAKPSREQQARTPHHLLDIVAPHEEYSVAQYVAAAREKIGEIRARGREVLFVGGTPLYLKALLRGLFDGPAADWPLRREIEAEVAEVGPRALHERLQQVDPVAASLIHPHDTRRMIRALEVFRATGEPISHLQVQFEEGRAPEACRVFVLRRPRPEQQARINARVEEMLSRGLAAEVERLVADGPGLGRTAGQAVGYREMIEHLAGRLTLAGAEARIKTRTRRFAKRQETWFRGLSECRFVDLEGDADAIDVARQLVRAGKP
jgi:tRNA dimethylallyltransferase